jgi:septum formation protein
VIADALGLGLIGLASRSPQRRALLEQLGIEFVVVESGYVERPQPQLTPEQLAVAHARGKCLGARGASTEWVLGADTLIALDGAAVGKPAAEPDARAMLRSLSGRTHAVISALCLAGGQAEYVRCTATGVRFRELGDDDIEWYLRTGEWRERAGAYAIQRRGAALVRSVDGDYTAVVGLSVPALLDAMAEASVR